MNNESNYGGLEEVKQLSPEELQAKGLTEEEKAKVLSGELTYKEISLKPIVASNKSVNDPINFDDAYPTDGRNEVVTTFRVLTPEEQQEDDNSCISCGS